MDCIENLGFGFEYFGVLVDYFKLVFYLKGFFWVFLIVFLISGLGLNGYFVSVVGSLLVGLGVNLFV